MSAYIRLDLWYLDALPMSRLEAVESLRGLGAMVRLLETLRRQKGAIGHKDMLNNIASTYHCDASWLWQIITNYELFKVMPDDSFYCPYQRETLGMPPHPGKGASRARKRERALYSEDSKDRENINATSACVCLDDTQQPHEEARAQTDYHQYTKYLNR